MANVNITDQLKMMIRSYVTKPFHEKYQTTATLSESESIQVYENFMVTPEQTELLNKLPKEWHSLMESENMNSKIVIAHSPDPSSRHIHKHWLQLQFKAPRKIHYLYAWTYTPTSDANNSESQNSGWRKFDFEKLGLSRDYLAELTAICQERDKTVDTIMKMLDGCSTLNQVQKIWPAITKYVDPSVVERLNRKPVRKTASNIGLDTDALQALSVHHIRQQMTT